VILNRSAVDRGLLHSTFFRTMREQNNKNHSTGEVREGQGLPALTGRGDARRERRGRGRGEERRGEERRHRVGGLAFMTRGDWMHWIHGMRGMRGMRGMHGDARGCTGCTFRETP
jgi:hypothetical protein